MPRKILIVHDMFLYRGGGERLMLLMARALGADVLAGFYDAGCYDPGDFGIDRSRIRTLVDAPPRSSSLRKLLLSYLFRTRTRRVFADYDTIIFSGDCLSAVSCVPANARALYYCHTPPRYLFDQRGEYLTKVRWFVRPLYALAFAWFRWSYRRDLRKIDMIMVNSKTVLKRLKDATGHDATIVYPCVDTEKFCLPEEPSRREYYLSFARLATIKRVDRIVEAFARLPEKQLILVHGPHDPERETILARIRDCANITPIESPSDEALISLIQHAIATIYVPRAEDFGMTPIESMACGTPVIAAADGGLLETVIDGETGYFVSAAAHTKEIIDAVHRLTSEVAQTMHARCRSRAEEFSYAVFRERVRSLVCL